jgi:hypothetical protein
MHRSIGSRARWTVLALVVVAARPALAQSVSAAGDRVWLGVNFGVANSAASAATFTFETELFFEPLILDASYEKPSAGTAFDVGGGVMITPVFGVGLTIARAAHADPAAVSLLVPHPFFFDASAEATGVSGDLARTERAVHVHLAVTPLRTTRHTLRLVAGPSFFRYTADMVRDIAFEQVATSLSLDNLVTITDTDVVEAEGTATGFHVGADVSVFFTHTIGVGAFARFSRATITLEEEPMSEVEQQITVGGFSVGGGVRLRF